MSHRQPTKIQTYEEFPYKLIEWKLHDKCNYDCFFCGDENKLGKVGWYDLETNKKLVDSIVKSAEGKPLWIQFTGGEPTLYPKFIELLEYVKSKQVLVNIISNGSRTIRYWKELRDKKTVDLVTITFHSQHKVDYKHIAEIANLFLYEETFVVIIVTYVKESVDYALEGIEYLKENTACLISTNAMDIVPYTIDENTIGKEKFDKILNEYNLSFGKKHAEKTPSQIDPTLKPWKMKAQVTYDDNTIEEKNVVQMMKLGENNFLGYECYAGIDSMNIENGFKFRGGCKRDKTPFTPENLTFFDKPFICDVTSCFCHMDMITTKIKKSD